MIMSVDLKKIGTENRNPRTMDIDRLPTEGILVEINAEDATVPAAVARAIPQITPVVDKVDEAFKAGGRLIYVGAGTSGRIGVLDAVECRPTYGVPDEMVQCLMAGGEHAFVKAVEGAEDSTTLPVADLDRLGVGKNDVVIGITASGRTPYVIAAVRHAHALGAVTAGITTSPSSLLAQSVDYPIEAITGAEPITGSTRMKSGTAQKLICNMISTAAMIKMGKVYENLMIDLQPTNEKLVRRAQSILEQATGCTTAEAEDAIRCFGGVKPALLSLLTGVTDVATIKSTLAKAQGNIRVALAALGKK